LIYLFTLKSVHRIKRKATNMRHPSAPYVQPRGNSWNLEDYRVRILSMNHLISMTRLLFNSTFYKRKQSD